jgi:hypothetical protein
MTSKYDSWLMAAPDTTDEDEYIEQRVYQLLKEEEYDPSDISHIAEAIAEADEESQQIIRDYIEQSNWQELGRKLFFMSYDYMEKFATSQAESEIQQGLHL